MGRVVRGGLIQVKADISLEGSTDDIKQRMLDKHLPLIDDAARRGVQLLCLQELFNGPYFCADSAALVRHGATVPTVHDRTFQTTRRRKGRGWSCESRGRDTGGTQPAAVM